MKPFIQLLSFILIMGKLSALDNDSTTITVTLTPGYDVSFSGNINITASWDPSSGYSGTGNTSLTTFGTSEMLITATNDIVQEWTTGDNLTIALTADAYDTPINSPFTLVDNGNATSTPVSFFTTVGNSITRTITATYSNSDPERESGATPNIDLILTATAYP